MRSKREILISLLVPREDDPLSCESTRTTAVFITRHNEMKDMARLLVERDRLICHHVRAELHEFFIARCPVIENILCDKPKTHKVLVSQSRQVPR